MAMRFIIANEINHQPATSGLLSGILLGMEGLCHSTKLSGTEKKSAVITGTARRSTSLAETTAVALIAKMAVNIEP